MRAVRFAILCIILGFITNVAVAWSLAAWLPQSGWHQRWTTWGGGLANGWIGINEYFTTGAKRRTWDIEFGGVDRDMPPRFFDAIKGASRLPNPERMDECLRGIQWGRFEQLGADPMAQGWDGCDHATGWPMLAAWYSLSTSSLQPHVTLTGGITLGPLSNPKTRRHPAWMMRALPLRPIWPGITINTTVFAVGWAILLIGSRDLRRWRRHNRGRCVRCAYDLTDLSPGQPCPECGTPVKLPSATPASESRQ